MHPGPATAPQNDLAYFNLLLQPNLQHNMPDNHADLHGWQFATATGFIDTKLRSLNPHFTALFRQHLLLEQRLEDPTTRLHLGVTP